MKVQQNSRLPPLLLRVVNEDNPIDELKEMASIIYHLRQSTKQWQQVYGSAARQVKDKWEQKADEFINQHISIDYEE
jgi:hypothetical protein